jgi:bifunctional UDP-N-acetylglucosamine pyrophosphorylase/glucosamine-1-phosphate N-acetyltransferase
MKAAHVVILAAGKGTRMKSALPKVLHEAAGLPLLEHVLRTVRALEPSSTTVVVGHGAGEIRQAFGGTPGLDFVVQEPQLGTAHALLQARAPLRGATGDVLLVYGDVPLLRPATLEALLDRHRADGAAATVITAIVEHPYGYGRVIRRDGHLVRVVEERDASPAERGIREVNAGIYAFALEPLFDALESIAAQNAQGEYYLPDLIPIYRRRSLPISTLTVADAGEIRGVNSRSELAEVSTLVRQKKNEELMAAGVTLIDPATTYVDVDVVVGADTVLHPNVYLEGSTVVGAACEIQSGSRLVNARVGDRVTIRNYCVVTDSSVADDAVVGPFAHLRPGSEAGEKSHIGNFVELKKTILGPGSKASHLTYLGDATIGANVNIGAGTITCNFDGTTKHPTIVEDGAFIGSDSQLVAPVRVGQGAYVAAGSTIVEDVPPRALGISRGRQVNKEGWVERKKK